MKTTFTPHHANRAVSALLLTMSLAAVALAILAGTMSWSATSTRLTHRSIQYDRSVAAAEAATEKVLSRMARDYLYGGEGLVTANLGSYRVNTVPSASDSAYWGNWEFNDATGNTNRTYLQFEGSSNNVTLNPPYAGLKGNVTTYSVVAHARETASVQDVIAGVLQQVQLASIPLFQFALYSSGDMEISCGQPFKVTGHVHANKTLYVEPDALFLTFVSGVTAVTAILDQRHPLDTRGAPSGGVVYSNLVEKVSPVDALTLPIGTTNTAEAVREIIEPPPSGGDTNLALANLRYYNKCDLLLVVTNTGVYATSGKFNSFSTPVPASELNSFVSTTNSFQDDREHKTVRPIDLNVGNLTAWSQTNNSLRPALLGSGLLPDVTCVYVVDARTLPGSDLGAVRVVNGRQLPASGLTVATGRPLYVLGDYNQMNPANLGTTNTITTRPASLVADAISILSTNWTDANSTSPLGARVAGATTVNAAFLTGVVETTLGRYSGGMENFPRFLEDWGATHIFTYNGSMIKMFPSLHATNFWTVLVYYNPPARNWAYDLNFNNPALLPPKSPSVLKVIRSRWATVARGQNVAP